MPELNVDPSQFDFNNEGRNDNRLYPDHSQIVYNLDPDKKTTSVKPLIDVDSLTIKTITNSSSEVDKRAFLEQRQDLASIENAMMDAATLIASGQLDQADQTLLTGFIANIGKEIRTLQSALPALKDKYASVFQLGTEKKAAQKPETPASPAVKPELDQSAERRMKAEQYVKEYLFGGQGQFSQSRIRFNEQTGKLELFFYRYTPNLEDARLDKEELLKSSGKEPDFSPDGAARKAFKDLPTLLRDLQHVLVGEIDQVLRQSSQGENQRALKAKIELYCINQISFILNALEYSYDSRSVVVDTKMSNPDKRGVILGAMLRREQGVAEAKAKRLHLPAVAYLDHQEVAEADLNDSNLLRDLQELNESSLPLMVKFDETGKLHPQELYAPLPEYALRGMEQFVDNNGQATVLLSANNIEAKFTETDQYAPLTRIREGIANLEKFTQVADYEKNASSRADLMRQKQTLEGEISSFLRTINPSVTRLEDVREVKKLFGGVTNQGDVTRAHELLQKRADLQSRLDELNKKFQASKPEKPYGDEQSKKNEIQKWVNQLSTVIKAEFQLPQLAEKFARGDEIPKIKIVIGEQAFRGLELEPISTLEERLRQRIKQRSQELATAITAATNRVIDLLVTNFDKTDALLGQVMKDKSQRAMIDAMIAYIEGTVFDNSANDFSIYRPDEATFYYAAQEARREPFAGNINIPQDLQSKVASFKALS